MSYNRMALARIGRVGKSRGSRAEMNVGHAHSTGMDGKFLGMTQDRVDYTVHTTRSPARCFQEQV